MAEQTGLKRVMTRRRFVHGIGLLGGAVALTAACAPAAPSPTPAATSKPAAPAATTAPAPASTTAPAATAVSVVATQPAGGVKKGGTLVWGETQEFNSFNPWGLNAANMIMQNILWNRMVALDNNGKPYGQLAESWNLAPDAKSITIKLRPGLKWHDGKDIVAEDIVTNVSYTKIEAISKNFGVARLAGLLPKGTEVTAPEKLTVQLKFAQATPAVFDILDYWYVALLADVNDPDMLKKLPSGTGPFKITEWVTGSHSTYKKFDGYWNQGFPYLDGMQIKRLEKAETLVSNLKAKALDIAAGIPTADIDSLRKDANYTVVANEGNGFHAHLMLNVKKPPFNNLKVRQAMAHAVDRDEIIKSAWFGVGTAIASPFYNPVSLAYDANLVKAYPYDLQRARKMLDDAGVKNLEINTFANSGWPEDKVMLQILQEDWKQINVKLNVTEVQTAQYYDRRYNGDFEMLAWFNARSLRDPYIFFGTQSEVTGRTVPFADPNPNLDKLAEQGAAEVDPEKRKTIYKECNRIVVEEMCNNIWYRTRPGIYGAAKYAKDWSWDTLGHIVFEKAWLDK